ncbi:MAG: hypothetical protein EAZ09_18505 [Oscillatoriales cyanobacterium]|nr:MAG: hypothetical protein EAZ18_04270 [Oscillatoriales cyanobacterium]TAH18319.1 MAG: hypothetical protein EAZ09_18505 [Oscillatoriales cyanobacterium]
MNTSKINSYLSLSKPKKPGFLWLLRALTKYSAKNPVSGQPCVHDERIKITGFFVQNSEQ